MTEPDLIQQQRTIARMLREMVNQYSASIEEAGTSHRRELTDVEQQYLDKTAELDALLTAFQEHERIARARVRGVLFGAFNSLEAAPAQAPSSNPVQTLVACVSEIERFVGEHSEWNVRLVFVTIPPDADKTAIVSSLNKLTSKEWKLCPVSGEKYLCSLKVAESIIQDMEPRGVKAEIAV